MKKIINGKTYNTDTAEFIDSVHPKGFSNWTEELYRKKNGEYFLYIKGGPSTKYRPAKPKIKPLSIDEVHVWFKLYIEGDDIVEFLDRLNIQKGGNNNA